MVVNDRPLKRHRRNRVSADLYDILSFPDGGDVDDGPPFREAVKLFLSRHARLTSSPSLFPSLQTWQILCRVGDRVEETASVPDLPSPLVALDIVEEDVTVKTSRSVYCNQCRVVGWSEHPVCRKRYHFIIKARSSSAVGSQDACNNCGSVLHFPESRCKWCDTVMDVDEREVSSQLEDNTHLLHGVVHSNGYGHLLLVNGREGDSKVLTGTDIMNFWDRLCKGLGVRKVSVMDMSRKYGMEYRLLHAVAKGHSWYGDWGYVFGRGSYALTHDDYSKAVDTLSGIPLSSFQLQHQRQRTNLQAVVAFYRTLSDSELVTLKDLFSFVLRLIHESNKPLSPKETIRRSESESTTNSTCAWTKDDVENVQQALIKVLRAASGKNSWITLRALKGALSKTASIELLDYCLKHLEGKVTACGMVVRSRTNSYNVEYRLSQPSFDGDNKGSKNLLKEHVIHDLKFLFGSLLHPETMVNNIPQVLRENMIDSATKLLDCKQFMKNYRSEKKIVNNPFAIYLWCHLELDRHYKAELSIPPELVILPANATLIDLKNEVSRAFPEVYPMFKRFEAEELLEYGTLEDSTALNFLVGPGGSIRIKGTCRLKHGLNTFRKEKGTENWTVNCSCGAKDDDGEKMLACDICGVWQHTRCTGIENSKATLEKFECIKCISSHIRKPTV